MEVPTILCFLSSRAVSGIFFLRLYYLFLSHTAQDVGIWPCAGLCCTKNRDSTREKNTDTDTDGLFGDRTPFVL